MKPVKSVHIFLLVASVALVAGQQQPKKNDTIAAKRYREQEPQFAPPPIPIQRRQQVFSNVEHPPSFFQQGDRVEARQIQVQQQPQAQFQQQPPQAQFQQQPNSFQQPNTFQQRQQEQPVPNQFQFNQQPQQQQAPNFQQNFQDQNNFQTRQQETLPTLPPVFIPPNSPVGPAPGLQSPIRNLFREPEPSFSLSGLLQRFLRLFNFGNNN